MRTSLSLLCLLLTTPALAQAPTPDMIQRLEKAQGGKLDSAALGKAMVIGTLVGCAQKQVGKEKAEAFYNSIQTVGHQAEALCKQGKPAEARQLVLNTVNAKRDDAVTKALVGCYNTNQAAVQQLGGAQMAADAGHYVRWVNEPALAAQELKESDVCHNLSPAGATAH